MPTTPRVRTSEVFPYVSSRQDFNTGGALRGRRGVYFSIGKLPGLYAAELATALGYDDLYVVTSYATPIAWFANGRWFVPDAKYSVTTTKHQDQVMRGIGAQRRKFGPGWR